MFNFEDIEFLVLNAIEHNGYWWVSNYYSDEVYVYLSCSIINGQVTYFLIASDGYERKCYDYCSLDFLFSFNLNK